MLRHPFLRIDVDRSLRDAKKLKQFLKAYRIDRIWMFRPCTCPLSWDERHGLHVDDLARFREQLAYVEERLGTVEYWNLHGSGTALSDERLKRLAQQLNRECVTFHRPVYSLKMGTVTGERKVAPKDVDLTTLKQIIFHPQYIGTRQMDELKTLLDRIENKN